MSGFLTPLDLEFIDGRIWRLTAPFNYHLGAPDGVEVIEVPKGFITDFASIPRVLWNLLPPIGKYGKAAVLHDWLYQTRAIFSPLCPVGLRLSTRAEADGVLREASEVAGVDWFTRWVIYAGIRLGGWIVWNKYRAQEAHRP